MDRSNKNSWITAGQYIWTQQKGYAIRSGSEWNNTFDRGAGHSATAVAMNEGVGYAARCGPCDNAGFSRGLATNASGGGRWRIPLP